MVALTKAGIKGPYVIGGWSWGSAFAANYPNKTKGLLLVDPASKEGYEHMAIQYPDVFTLIFQERVDNNLAAKEEFDDMATTMYQASLSDQNYQGKIELLIAGSMKEMNEYEMPLKKIWIDELVKLAKTRTNSNYGFMDIGHGIQFEKPEVVIEAIKRLVD